ncbi:MAG: hypothetical protein AAF609_05340 [Cyanobacteria bacterium P01_C01_bin.120]
MRRALLRCPELIAVECWIEPGQIRIGILIPNPRQLPGDTLTLYDTTSQPPTAYPVSLTGETSETTYRVTLLRHGPPI